MAKRKKRKSAKKKEQTYSIELKGILLVLIMIIGCSPFGILSNLIKGFAGFLVGSWYVVLLVLVGICGLYMIVKREYPEFFSSKFIGFYVMCLGILVLSHTGYVQKIGENSEVFVLCAKIEEEISDLDEADKKEFLADMGVETSGLDRLISASYKLLGLISYLTAGVTESRAWTIKKGTKAPGAAGKIHSDFERGFIRAEVVSYDDLINIGYYNGAKEQGLVRSEGKEYVVKDGDVILFRFNV